VEVTSGSTIEDDATLSCSVEEEEEEEEEEEGGGPTSFF